MCNKLFITCPFSHLEPFLKSKYGNDSYFISAPGSISAFQEPEFTDSIKWVVLKENIKEIYFTVDTDCRFLNNVLNKLSVYDTDWEYKLQALFERYFTEITSVNTKQKQQEIFAQRIITRQVEDLIKAADLNEAIVENKIQLKGLVTTRKNDLCKGIKITISDNELTVSIE